MQQGPEPHTPPPRRLVRSTRDRMWAGVAGGLAEYFDVDPALVRLIWVASAVFSGGLAILVYFALWWVMPTEERVNQLGQPESWRRWSREVEEDTRRFAEEARRMANAVAEQIQGGTASPRASSIRPEDWPSTVATAETVGLTDEATAEVSPEPKGAASAKGEPSPVEVPPPPSWPVAPRRDFEPNHLDHRQRFAGIILLGIGLLLLAANAGVFRWINWSVMWPLVLIGFGVWLLARQGMFRR